MLRAAAERFTGTGIVHHLNSLSCIRMVLMQTIKAIKVIIRTKGLYLGKVAVRKKKMAGSESFLT